MIFGRDKVKTDWMNVLYYYQETKAINKVLCSFLNRTRNYQELAKHKLSDYEIFDEQQQMNFAKELIECTKINEEAFKFLKNSIPWKFKTLNILKTSQIRLGSIIKYDLLALSPDNVNLLKEKSSLHIPLIIRNIDIFLKEQENYQLDLDDIQKILNSNLVNFEKKVSLINHLQEDFIKESKELVDLIYKILLEDEMDLEIRINILDQLIECHKIKEEKIKLFVRQIHYLDKENITNILTKLEKPYSKLKEKGKRPTIPNNEVNKELAKALMDVNYISSISEENKKLRINTKWY